MQMGVELVGMRRVALRFEQFPEIARAKLVEVITAFQAQLFAEIQRRIPRGQTGAIANALAGGVESQASKVRGWVSLAGGDRKTVILPAIALEYGSNRAVAVRAKDGRLLYTVYGRYINPMRVNVDAYTRQSNIVAQRFMRGPLEDMASSVIGAMKQSVTDAAKAA